MSRMPGWSAVLALVAVLVVPALSVAQPVTVTVVMKSGERHSGQNLQHRANQEVSLRKSMSDQLRTSPDQVAYVDFGGGAPSAQVSLTGSQQAIVLRDGRVIKGQLVEMGHTSFEDTNTPYHVVFRDEQGQQHEFSPSQVARVYFSGGATPATQTGTQGQAGTTGGGIVVPATQQWTSTGLNVRQGETLRFNATGQIQLGPNATDAAQPAGVMAQRRAEGSPLPNELAGALIAKIGANGRPFAIGNQTSVQMPASGELFLGVNDSNLNDNQGEFRVEIQRGGSPVRRR